MDKLDWKILQVLDWKGREPVNKIAKTIKSNKDVVAYRIKKLEEKEVIVRYYPVLNMYKLGYNTSRLYFDLEEIGEDQEAMDGSRKGNRIGRRRFSLQEGYEDKTAHRFGREDGGIPATDSRPRPEELV